MNNKNSLRAAIDKLISAQRVQLLSILISQLRDIELAEDALQDALIKAWSNWQKQGIPSHPKSWILKTAYNQAIDIIRRQQNFNSKQAQISHLLELMHELNTSMNDELIPDERLKLIFTCCHPALDQAKQGRAEIQRQGEQEDLADIGKVNLDAGSSKLACNCLGEAEYIGPRREVHRDVGAGRDR